MKRSVTAQVRVCVALMVECDASTGEPSAPEVRAAIAETMADPVFYWELETFELEEKCD